MKPLIKAKTPEEWHRELAAANAVRHATPPSPSPSTPSLLTTPSYYHSDLLALAPSRSFDGWAGRRWTMSCRDACPWRWASLRLASLQPQELDWTQQWMGDLLAWRLYDVGVARFPSSMVNSAHPRLRACCCSPDGGDFNEEQARLRRVHQCFLRRHPDWPRCHQGTVF